MCKYVGVFGLLLLLLLAVQRLNWCFVVPEKKGSLTTVWETLVRVLTSVGMWKTSRLTIDWLLYCDRAPRRSEKGQRKAQKKTYGHYSVSIKC